MPHKSPAKPPVSQSEVPDGLFWRAEWFVIGLIAALIVTDVALAFMTGIGIMWPQVIKIVMIAFLVLGVGIFYRLTARSETIAMSMIATSALLVFSLLTSTLNYMMLPISRPPIDDLLNRIDLAIGWSWPNAVAFAGDYPWFSIAAKSVYMSSLPQLALVVILLGLLGHRQRLHTFLIALVVTGIAAVLFWGLFPSLGPSSVYTLSPEVQEAAKPFLGNVYGEKMKLITSQGIAVIDPNDIEGLIAFPSYHTVMALLTLYGAYSVRYLFPVLATVNLLMIPGIVMHGGHFLIDVIGGFALFVLGLNLAKYLMNRFEQSEDNVLASVPSSVPAE